MNDIQFILFNHYENAELFYNFKHLNPLSPNLKLINNLHLKIHMLLIMNLNLYLDLRLLPHALLLKNIQKNLEAKLLKIDLHFQ